MTKTELCQIVDRIYLSWNQQINPVYQKQAYEAWWRILKDLNKDDVDLVLDDLVIENSYMPRVGEVRRRTVDLAHGESVPTGGEAWQQFRRAADAAHSGNYSSESIHALVSQTVKALGGVSSYNLHTNGDREMFLSTYDKIVKEYEKQLYALSEPVADALVIP